MAGVNGKQSSGGWKFTASEHANDAKRSFTQQVFYPQTIYVSLSPKEVKEAFQANAPWNFIRGSNILPGIDL